MKINGSKEELKELKMALNELISSRIIYRSTEKSKVRLSDNEKYLLLDYKLLEEIIKSEK